MPPKKAMVRGIVLPGFINHHTHIGDSVFAAAVQPKIGQLSLEELVAPPDGLKHRLLAAASTAKILAGMHTSLETIIATGTEGFVDFREGGFTGIALVKEALDTFSSVLRGEELRQTTPSENHNGNATDVEPVAPWLSAVLLGRPQTLTYVAHEVDRVLDAAYGMGLSARRDWPQEAFIRLARHVHRRSKVFALHASEHLHEPLTEIIEAKPHFLVHVIHATPSEWRNLAEVHIPVVCCPRANALFNQKPPVSEMLTCGVTVLLGTDNGMFVPPSILAEVTHTYRHVTSLRKEGKTGFRRTLQMALPCPNASLAFCRRPPIGEGFPARFHVYLKRGLAHYAHPEQALADMASGGWPIQHLRIRGNAVMRVTP
jgi:cytosine/adenosine deaminase-related metal-dependent hydrolase